MEQTTAMFFQKCVQDFLKKNEEYLTTGIANNTDRAITTEQITAQMIANSIQLSVEMSTLFIMAFLENQNIITLNEKEIQKCLLTLLEMPLSSHQTE